MISARHNIAAMEAISNTERSNKATNKAARRLSTGEKITSAVDDASAYQISERMRVLINGLNQCDRNTKEGSDLLNIAAGAIEKQKEIMTTVREKILEAMNGTLNEIDLMCVQQEIDAKLEAYNEIAETTNFNGRYLLDGTAKETKVPCGVRAFLPNSTLFHVNESPAVDFFPDKPDDNSRNGKWHDVQPNEFINISGVGANLGGGAVSYTFSFLSSLKGLGSIPKETLHMQGFSLNCCGCNQFTTVVLDSTIKNSESKYYSTADPGNPNNHALTNSGSFSACYRIGISDIKKFDDVYAFIYNGVMSAIQGAGVTPNLTNSGVIIGQRHNFCMKYDKQTNTLSLNKTDSGLAVLNGVRGIDTVNYFKAEKELPLQTGTRSNQQLQAKLPCTLLSENFKEIPTKELNVYTYDSAEKFLSHIDWEMDYILDAATTVGVQIKRLGYTSDNLVVSSENTTTSESTIRDADMAKEFTNYNKYQILQQASQAMIASANQSVSNVLQLLQ